MNFITAQELKTLIESAQPYILLDCRGKGSFEAEHIVTAQNIQWSDIASEATKIIPDKNMLVITSCSSMTCDASEKCYAELKSLGYTNLKEYSGGLADWLAHGFGTVKQSVPQ